MGHNGQPSAPPVTLINQPALPPAQRFVDATSRVPETPAPKVASTSFESLYRAAKAVEGATEPGVTYAKFGELLQTFSKELSIATDHALNDDDRELVAGYAKAYEAYP
jgi:hypothetical protein